MFGYPRDALCGGRCAIRTLFTARAEVDTQSVHYMQHSLAYANGKSLPTIGLFQRAKLQILEGCVHAGVDLRAPKRKSRGGQEAAKRTPRGGPRAESGGGQEEVKRRTRGGQEEPQRSPRRGPEERRTTTDDRRPTNDERRTTNDDERTANDERRTTNDERRTTNDEGGTTTRPPFTP